MQATILWQDRPSQLQHLLLYLSCILLVPFPFALWRYLLTQTTRYTLTAERLIVTTGVFHQQQEEVELYRVKDYSVSASLLYRWLGLANICLLTSDHTHPTVVLSGIWEADRVKELIRERVEALRLDKGVREID